MEVRFNEEVPTASHKYVGFSSTTKHINRRHTVFVEYLWQDWVHLFIHTLEMTPITLYASMELWQGTQDWEEIAKQFVHIFEFAYEQPIVEAALQILKA